MLSAVILARGTCSTICLHWPVVWAHWRKVFNTQLLIMFVILKTDNHKGREDLVVVWHERKPQCKKEEVIRGNLHASTDVNEKEKGRPELWFPVSLVLGDRFTSHNSNSTSLQNMFNHFCPPWSQGGKYVAPSLLSYPQGIFGVTSSPLALPKAGKAWQALC